MRNKRKHRIIPIFIPHLGCPHDCSFCNQKNITGQINIPTENDIKKTIKNYIQTIQAPWETFGRGAFEIAFYGGSFTGLDPSLQVKFLAAALNAVEENHEASFQGNHETQFRGNHETQFRGNYEASFLGIRVSTRPDYINDDILKLLNNYHVKTIELGVQSLDDYVLEKNGRGHTRQDVFHAVGLIKNHHFKLGIQTMTGLYRDTYNKAIDTANTVVSLKPDFVRIYPTLVIEGTYLAKLYRDGLYEPESMEEAVGLCADLMEIYAENNIPVIRAGLCPTEDLASDRKVLAGPFHPAFKQLAVSRIFFNKILAHINAFLTFAKSHASIPSAKNENYQIIIHTPSKNASNIIGNKKENIEKLKMIFKNSYVKIIVQDDVTFSNRYGNKDFHTEITFNEHKEETME